LDSALPFSPPAFTIRPMKRILLSSRCPPYPRYLGDRLVFWHLASGLEARGPQLARLALSCRPEDAGGLDWSGLPSGHARLRPLPANRQWTYIQRALLPSARFPRQAHQAASPQMWQAIEQQLAQHTYDVVHLFGGVQVYEYHHALKHLPTVITPYEAYSLYL